MSIVAAYVVPHPPLIVPAVGHGQERAIQATVDAYEEVARRIAALHGGSIVFEQREERGSRAIVSLPLRPPEPGELLKTPRMGFDGSGGFSDTLIELAGVLPYRAFFPEDVE